MTEPSFVSALTLAIHAVRNKLVESGHYPDFAAINAGYCGDFADDVTAELERQGWDDPGDFFSQVDIQMFLAVDPNTGFAQESGPFDRTLLKTHWPDVIPPDGMTWDNLDQLSSDHGFCAGTHVWMAHEHRFYDAETPDGVQSFFDLPFFQRIIAKRRPK